MQKILAYDCVSLENESLRLLVTKSTGPRILSLCFNGGENLFAELPDFVTERPDGKKFHFRGGHRLWHAPEHMPRTYSLDDQPVEIIETPDGLTVKQPVEEETGIEKHMRISLVNGKPQVTVEHTLINRGLWEIECAPWAITQLRRGGVAILPQSQTPHAVLPNRSLALWAYTDLSNPQVTWGNDFLLVRAEMDSAFKVGFPNPRGWLAYWLDGTLFVKHAAFDRDANYFDHGSSSECYCNDKFLELETLAPIRRIAPGASAGHTETWTLYSDIEFPADEKAARRIADTLGLE